jgi:hypothetical protein
MLGNFTRNCRAISALIKTAQQKWTLYLHAFLARVCSQSRYVLQFTQNYFGSNIHIRIGGEEEEEEE